MKPMDKMKYSQEIIKELAKESKPLSPYDLKKKIKVPSSNDLRKETSIPYTGIRETLKRLCANGYVELKKPEQSKKGGNKTLYALTFKGVLKYLSEFAIIPESFDKLTKKEIDELTSEFDKKNQTDLLRFIEREGQPLNYAPFQECRFLLAFYPGIIRSFISNAKLFFNPAFASSLNSAGRLADDFGKCLDQPNFPLGINDLLEMRNMENSFLKDNFGKLFLKSIVGNVWVLGIRKIGGLENEKLRQFAQRILDENRPEIIAHRTGCNPI